MKKNKKRGERAMRKKRIRARGMWFLTLMTGMQNISIENRFIVRNWYRIKYYGGV